MHGIAIDGRRMYLTPIQDVYRAEINEDGTLGELERIIDDLPDAGQHPNRTIALGPDGKLYISQHLQRLRRGQSRGRDAAPGGAHQPRARRRAAGRGRRAADGASGGPGGRRLGQGGRCRLGRARRAAARAEPARRLGRCHARRRLAGVRGQPVDPVSPPLSWSAGPEGTRSYALLLEDPDAAEPKPFVHWIMYNLPPEVRSLREGIPGAPRLELPDGALQGQNSRGSTGYFGMKPPAGPAHRYHVEVLALDQALDLPAGAAREAVLDAVEGHILAAGDLVGTFQKP